MIQKIILPFLLLGTSLISTAQSDTIPVLATKKDTIVVSAKNDTIQIGSMLIVKKEEAEKPAFKSVIKIGDLTYGDPKDGEKGWFKGDLKKTRIEISKSPKKLKNIETNWWIFDLGFANFIDKSPDLVWLAANPSSISFYPGAVISPGSYTLINKKSTNVNIWVVTQKLNIYQHKINLKYGLGLETFNFRFDKSISFREDIVTNVKYDVVAFTKNKLFVKYFTVPLQLNFSPNPTNKKAFYASIGMSAGYLWNAKNKQISGERGKEKYRGNFNLNDWRFATIGELGVGAVRLYGSFANTNLFNENQVFVDMQPFAVGLRFSKF